MITFALVVDNFGVKYAGHENFHRLIEALQDLYEITVDEEVKKYLGLTIKWDFDNRKVRISIPDYVEKTSKHFHHIARGRPQHSPHLWNKPTFGANTQFTKDNDSTPAPKSASKYVQQVVGTFLYYAIALNLTMLVALGSIGTQQNNPTNKTMSEITWFLYYCTTHPDKCIEYKVMNMILWTSSNASYLSENNARSRAGAIFFLGPKPNKKRKTAKHTTPNEQSSICPSKRSLSQ